MNRLLLLLSCLGILFGSIVCNGQESAGEDALEDDAVVESDDKTETPTPSSVDSTDDANSVLAGGTEPDAMPDGLPPPSLSADVALMVVEPALGRLVSAIGVELPVAPRPVRCLLAFTHLGGSVLDDFVLDAVEAAIRYPQDYSYYLQNFTALSLYQLRVPIHKQATVAYSFSPAQQLAGRSYGVTIRLRYRLAAKAVSGEEEAGAVSGEQFFTHTVFNDTVMLVEAEEGLWQDTETLSMYLVLVCLAVLGLAGLYHVAATSHLLRKPLKSLAGAASAGGQGGGSGGSGPGSSSHASQQAAKARLLASQHASLQDVDLDWIPQRDLQTMTNRRSPQPTRREQNQQSPRQKKVR